MLKKKLGKYEIIDWLGGGRFGDVFLARDTILDKKFALKISRMRKEEINMLKDEAKLLATLDHPHIVRFYNIDFIENKFVMVMEYVRGRVLRDLIEKKGIEIDRIINIGTQLLEAIDYAHQHKVLHRDLKPENILIAEIDGKEIVKITDFGLARFIRSDSVSASTAGTPIYMAPETWAGSFTDRSDIWSVAVILYELITGTPPFLDDSLSGLKKKIDKNVVLAPNVVRPQIPEDIEEIIMKCLKTDPRNRPDAAGFLKHLSRRRKGVKGIAVVRPAEAVAESLKLSPDQVDAIENLDGVVLLLGQAGCGKTTTLTHGVARLIEQGTSLARILIVTFTTKAANDIRARLNRYADRPGSDQWLGTLHTLGLRILRRDAERIDISDDFTIADPKRLLAEMKIEKGKYRSNAIVKTIGLLKAKAVMPEQFTPQNQWESFCLGVYKEYEDYKKEKTVLDYDDLILYSVKLLEEHEDVRAYYQDLFDYVFVDEIQDINPAQYRMISLIAKKSIFFTGDEDQSIYGWRGADPNLIHRIAQDYKDIKIFNLSRSFRLTQGVLEIANKLMLRNATAIPIREGGEVMVYAAKSEQDEADYVIREVTNLHKDGFGHQDMAVLFRMNHLSRIYEEAMTQARIPHTVIGGFSFYERADIKPLIEYLEELGQDRPIKHNHFAEKGLSIFKITGRDTARIKKLFQYHLDNAHLLAPAEIISGLITAAGLKGENIEEMLNRARVHTGSSLKKFLNEIRLIQELDLVDWGKETVKLMTIHSAKGIEFPIVFLVDMVEDVFPMTKKMSSQGELEEERRLCYVALTRAQRKIFLLYPKWRYGRQQKPSRFLIDMFKAPL